MKKHVSFEETKICIPTSSGGHLTHMMLLKPFWENHDRFWVTFNKIDAQSQLKDEKKYWCHYPTNGNYWNLFRNFFLAWKILRKERPDIIISSGAAISIPFFWLGKKYLNANVFMLKYMIESIKKQNLVDFVINMLMNSLSSGKKCLKFIQKLSI